MIWSDNTSPNVPQCMLCYNSPDSNVAPLTHITLAQSTFSDTRLSLPKLLVHPCPRWPNNTRLRRAGLLLCGGLKRHSQMPTTVWAAFSSGWVDVVISNFMLAKKEENWATLSGVFVSVRPKWCVGLPQAGNVIRAKPWNARCVVDRSLSLLFGQLQGNSLLILQPPSCFLTLFSLLLN